MIDAPVDEAPERESRYRPALRGLIATVVGVAVAGLWWLRTPTQLTGTTDILGYPAFAAFNYTRLFTAYRLIVYGGPGVILATYALLSWRGPLRRPDRPPRSAVPLSDALVEAPAPDPDVDATEVEPATTAGRPGESTPGALVLAVVRVTLRIALPAGVLAIGVSTRSTAGGLTAPGVSAALCYVLAIAGLAAAFAAVQPAGWSWTAARRGAAVANGLAGAVIAIGAVWLASSHTAVRVRADGRTTSWPWLPWWVAVLAAAMVVAWSAMRLRRRAGPVELERRLLSVVVGSALVFLLTSSLPGTLGHFQGFDDAQDLAGNALLAKGYFPWRDLTFVHGLWFDVLRGTFGTAVFENSRWGEFSGNTVLVAPLCWVALYLFAIWYTRRNVLVVVTFVLLAFGGQLGLLEWRFLLVPVALILLGETLRRHDLRWTAAFAFVTFAQGVLVPETAYLAASCVVVLVLSDFVHRVPGAAVVRTFRRTLWFLASGLVLTVGFAIFLAAAHSLGAFIDYYRVFGPGHDASGAIPATNVHDTGSWVKFGLAVALVLLTVWFAIARFRSRRSWTSRDWVLLAIAGFVALYGEKPLGRLDDPHIKQFLAVALPLGIVWLARALNFGDGLLHRWWRTAAGRPLLPMRRPVSVIAAIVAAALVPALVASVRAVPDRLHAVVAAEPAIARLGYATPHAVEVNLLDDVRTVLSTYAGQSGDVFDMSNSPGYTYYLLGREPGTRYYHVSMAVPPFAQNQLVDQLERSRPPVVIFDTTTIGLPRWDGLDNSVRHVIVSQYLLDGWTPILRTHGVLIMVRRDLVRSLPPLPTLSTPPVTDDLYFSGTGACRWGDIPNFFRPTPAGNSMNLPVPAARVQPVESVSGWAVDPVTRAPIRLVALTDGSTVLATTVPSRPRTDVAQSVGPPALNSGFVATAVMPSANASTVPLALTADGTLHPIGLTAPTTNLPASLRLPDGRQARVDRDPVLGGVDDVVRTTSRLSAITLPDGTNLASFALATFSTGSPAPIGPADFWLADNPSDARHRIEAQALARGGSSMSLRVGSCLQWHGYSGRTLFLGQAGGHPITDLHLSGVG